MTAKAAGKTVLGGEVVPPSTSEVVMNGKIGTTGALLTGIVAHLVPEEVAAVDGGEEAVAEEAEVSVAHRLTGIMTWMAQ